MLGPAVAMLHRHAVLVERDDRRFQVEPLAQIGRAIQRLEGAAQNAAGGEPGFEAVRRDRGAAVILAIIVPADWIGYDLDLFRAGRADDRA